MSTSFTIILFALFPIFLNAQAPKKVLNIFNARYKTAKQVVWSDTTENQLKVTFNHYDQRKMAIYKTDGSWVKTLIYLEPRELMYCMRDHIAQHYPNHSIGESYMTRSNSEEKYHAVLQPKQPGSQMMSILFSNHCELIEIKK